MEEILNILQQIAFELESINEKLDRLEDIQGDGLYNSISDVCSKLEDIQGDGLYNSISDVCSKLDDIGTKLDGIDSSIMFSNS